MNQQRQVFEEVELFGVPVDFGANKRGVGMAPMAFRLAGVLEKIRAEGIAIRDGGDIRSEHYHSDRWEDNLREVGRVCKRLEVEVHRSMKARRLPLVIGGDHSVAIGTIAGVSRYYRGRKKRFGVLWIDAHGDMNTPETSLSGNIHGMPLAINLGEGPPSLLRLGGFTPKIEATRCALVGIRNLDEKEKENIARFGIKVFTMKDIDKRGLPVVMEEAIQTASQGNEGMHVSFDMDVVDPTIAPGVGTAVPGGLSYREAHLVMEMIHDCRAMTSLEVVEANPIIDLANTTARLGTELILSALGKSIY